MLSVMIDENEADFMHSMRIVDLSPPLRRRFLIVDRRASIQKASFGAISNNLVHLVLDGM